MSTATVTSKGQITIPHNVRREMGIDAGDKVTFIKMDDGRFAIFAATGSIKDLKGIVPRPKKPVTIEEMQKAIEDAACGK